jgi:Ran GTPase-activating protein (RanGAP) involved in mRNA processing and transport
MGEALADALTVNATLLYLDLHRNRICDCGAAAVCDAVRINVTLARLNLCCNNIGDVGAAKLASALKTNKSLTVLSLHANEIGDEGAAAIGEMLKANAALVHLYLGKNRFTTGGAKSLLVAVSLSVEQVPFHCTLSTLDLRDNCIPDELPVAIDSAIWSNRSFRASAGFRPTLMYNLIRAYIRNKPDAKFW